MVTVDAPPRVTGTTFTYSVASPGDLRVIVYSRGTVKSALIAAYPGARVSGVTLPPEKYVSPYDQLFIKWTPSSSSPLADGGGDSISVLYKCNTLTPISPPQPLDNMNIPQPPPTDDKYLKDPSCGNLSAVVDAHHVHHASTCGDSCGEPCGGGCNIPSGELEPWANWLIIALAICVLLGMVFLFWRWPRA